MSFLITALYIPLVITFWIFILWVLWTIAQSLKGIELSVRQISQSLRDRN